MRARLPSEDVLRPAWAEVDLDALRHNLAHLRKRTNPARALAVIKADAYGHGAVAVGRELAAAGVEWLGVALVEEGAALRQGGIEAPILVLGPAQEPQLPLFGRYRLTPTVSSLAQLALWRDFAAGSASRMPIHLEVDTGMTRLGISIDECGEALAMVRRSSGLALAGLLSHLADADLPDSPHNSEQIERFAALIALLRPEERDCVEVHLANTAGALHHPAGRHSLVRLGLGLFGLDPAAREAGLQPILAVKARVVLVRDVPAGVALGYGGLRTTTRPSRIAVLPVGYGDGYGWRLSNRSDVLLGGRRAPVAGAVSMDLILVDATDTGAALGDEAVLLGRQDGEEITAAELARLAGTIPYEILCALGLRLTRRYRRGGELAEEASRFTTPLP